MVPAKFLKKLSGTDIWECRVEYESNIYRFLGFFAKNAIVILTNGFQKKSQKTPQKFIEIAEECKSDYLRRKK